MASTCSPRDWPLPAGTGSSFVRGADAAGAALSAGAGRRAGCGARPRVSGDGFCRSFLSPLRGALLFGCAFRRPAAWRSSGRAEYRLLGGCRRPGQLGARPAVASWPPAVRRLLSEGKPRSTRSGLGPSLDALAGAAIRRRCCSCSCRRCWSASGVVSGAGRAACGLAPARGRVPLVLLAVQRERATGRFTLTTEAPARPAPIGRLHAGGVQGPGGSNRGPGGQNRAGAAARRRRFRAGAASGLRGTCPAPPGFPCAAGSTQRLAERSKRRENLFWSLASPGVLPVARSETGARLRRPEPVAARRDARPSGSFRGRNGSGAPRRDRVFSSRCGGLSEIGPAGVVHRCRASARSRPGDPRDPLAVPLWRAVSGSGALALAALVVAVPARAVLFPRLQAAVERRDPDLPRPTGLTFRPGGRPVWCAMDTGRLFRFDGRRWRHDPNLRRDPLPATAPRWFARLPPLRPGRHRCVGGSRIPYAAGTSPGEVESVARSTAPGGACGTTSLGELGSGWREVGSPATPDAPPGDDELLAVEPIWVWNWGQGGPVRFRFDPARSLIKAARTAPLPRSLRSTVGSRVSRPDADANAGISVSSARSASGRGGAGGRRGCGRRRRPCRRRRRSFRPRPQPPEEAGLSEVHDPDPAVATSTVIVRPSFEVVPFDRAGFADPAGVAVSQVEVHEVPMKFIRLRWTARVWARFSSKIPARTFKGWSRPCGGSRRESRRHSRPWRRRRPR